MAKCRQNIKEDRIFSGFCSAVVRVVCYDGFCVLYSLRRLDTGDDAITSGVRFSILSSPRRCPIPLLGWLAIVGHEYGYWHRNLFAAFKCFWLHDQRYDLFAIVFILEGFANVAYGTSEWP
jgi:hypothetical protein